MLTSREVGELLGAQAALASPKGRGRYVAGFGQ
jgi:hypothetical protein